MTEIYDVTGARLIVHYVRSSSAYGSGWYEWRIEVPHERPLRSTTICRRSRLAIKDAKAAAEAAGFDVKGRRRGYYTKEGLCFPLDSDLSTSGEVRTQRQLVVDQGGRYRDFLRASNLSRFGRNVPIDGATPTTTSKGR